VLAPLLAAALAAGVVPAESSRGTLELLLACGMKRWQLALHKLSGALAVFSLTFVTLLLLSNTWTYEVALSTMLYQTAPASLVLFFLAFLSGERGRSVALGLGIPVGYWLVCLMFKGQLTRDLYLFSDIMPAENMQLLPLDPHITMYVFALVLAVLSVHLFARR
jgi:ABC-type transport system involved in multi-copper enzyme maturation permease subunit